MSGGMTTVTRFNRWPQMCAPSIHSEVPLVPIVHDFGKNYPHKDICVCSSTVLQLRSFCRKSDCPFFCLYVVAAQGMY